MFFYKPQTIDENNVSYVKATLYESDWGWSDSSGCVYTENKGKTADALKEHSVNSYLGSAVGITFRSMVFDAYAPKIRGCIKLIKIN